jgi:hypothetical protein
MMVTDLEHSVVLQGAQIARIHQRIIDSVLGNVPSSPWLPAPKALRFLSAMTVKLNCRDLFLTINYYSTQLITKLLSSIQFSIDYSSQNCHY